MPLLSENFPLYFAQNFLIANSPFSFRYSLSVDDLDEHVRRLRRWLAATILRPLVRKIDKMNERFEQQSRPDLRIGEASIASLQVRAFFLANECRVEPNVL